MKPTEEATAGHEWGPDSPPPVNAPVVKSEPASEPKPKRKAKAIKVTKSKAAEIKEALEKGQVAGPDITDKLNPDLKDGKTGKVVDVKLTKKGKLTKGSKAKVSDVVRAAMADKYPPKQVDMVDAKMIIVPESPLYKAGKKAKDIVAQEEMIKDAKAEAVAELLKAMRKAKKYRYAVEGYSFELEHKGPQDKIKVVKPK